MVVDAKLVLFRDRRKQFPWRRSVTAAKMAVLTGDAAIFARQIRFTRLQTPFIFAQSENES